MRFKSPRAQFLRLWRGWLPRQTNRNARRQIEGELSRPRNRSLKDQNLAGSNLSGVSFDDIDLTRCRLNHANLSFSNFEKARHLSAEGLAGADLRAATMPSSFKFDLDPTNDLLRNCRSLSATLLISSIYMMIAAASTKDVDLLTASRKFTLPLVNAEVSLFGFYAFGPIALILFGLFFYIVIGSAFDRLARLPAVFPNGALTDEAVAPWLTSELIRWRQPRLRRAITPTWITRTTGAILLTWLIVPSTVAFIWLKYLKRHDAALTVFHVSMLALATLLSLNFLYSSVTGNRLSARVGIGLLALTGIVAVAPATYISSAVLQGGTLPQSVAFVLDRVGYKANLDLVGAIVSRRPDNWSPFTDPQFQEVTGADLARASLRNADARHVFLARANLTQADMRSARLGRTRMQFANLTEANGEGAVFDDADFRGALLYGANFRKIQAARASFEAATLRHTVLSSAILEKATFKDADLDDAHLDGAYLREARITSTKMRQTDLRRAMLYEATLYADLSGAKLDNADIRGADLSQSTGLTQDQLISTCMDKRTKLPVAIQPNQNVC